MIIGFIGQRGSGKTLTMVRYAYEKYRQGYKVLSNINLEFPHTTYTIDDLLEYAESGRYFGKTCIIIDEIHILFDSRSSGKSRNRIFSYFINMSSKNQIDVYWTSQFSRQVEIRLRLNTEIVIECNCKCIVWKSRHSKPQILLNYRPMDSDYKCISVIQNKIHKFGTYGVSNTKTIRYVGNKYFKLYNTKEVVLMQKDKYEIAKDSKKKITTKQKLAEQSWNMKQHKQFMEDET